MSTPYEQLQIDKAERLREKIAAEIKAEKWHIRLGSEAHLKDCLASMKDFSLAQEDIPFIIKLVENPKYDIGLFAGYVDLFTHDCIHILLGRGLLIKDEAFVIGYTMGTSKKMFRWRRNLFMFCAKYLYPDGYDFGEDERFVFNMGVLAGAKCKTDLSKVDFKKFLNKSISETRDVLGIDTTLIRGCYIAERALFKKSVESQRLI